VYLCGVVAGNGELRSSTVSTNAAALSKLIPFAVQGAFSEPEQLLTAYFHESTVGLGIFDKEFRFLAINPALAQMNGKPAVEHLGKPCREVLGDFADKVEPELRRILAGGQPVVGLELSGILPTRDEIGHWIANYFPIQDASGKVKKIGVVVVEITAQKKLEESLRHLAGSLQQEKTRLQALRDVDDALVASLDLHQMLPVVSQCLRRTLPHDHVAISVYDETAKGLREYAATSDVKRRICPANGVFPLGDSLTGQTFVEGKSRVYNHAELVDVPFPVTRWALEAGILSSCFVPLVTAKGRVGVFTLSSRKDNAFRQEDLEFLEQVAAALAQALQNALARKTLQEEKKRLQVLLNVSTALAANWNVQEAFLTISAYLRRVLRQEYAAFVLLDEKSGLLVRQALDFPLGRGLCAAVEVTAADGPAGRALRERKCLTFSQEQMQSFSVDSTNCLLAEGIRSLCSIPLLRPKGPLGVLTLASTREDAFRPDNLVLLNQIAAQLAVALENHRVSLEIEALKDRLSAERKYLEGEIHTEHNFEEIVGQSPVLKQTLKQVQTVAGSDATVLILGETGTGKELVARAIHGISKRKDRSFIKLNCAAIPTGLLESELFGHEKGAFTGAVNRKIGRLELADQGTLFLDEVGEIPAELQPKLLRVLQDHEFERLGGTKTIKVDLRLIAATNRDLSKSVQEHEFRGDLFYRLNVFPIRMPSLRERREDIPLLVRHFVRKFARRLDRNIETIPTETMNALINWDWPGNVRELENFIERSIILSEGEALQAPLGELQMASRGSGPTASTLENAEREHILRVLRESGGVISGPTGAAHRLGLKRSTLQSKMDRLGIRRNDYANQRPA
jgi:formate hydrogenlyase transcriptional activator